MPGTTNARSYKPSFTTKLFLFAAGILFLGNSLLRTRELKIATPSDEKLPTTSPLTLTDLTNGYYRLDNLETELNAEMRNSLYAFTVYFGKKEIRDLARSFRPDLQATMYKQPFTVVLPQYVYFYMSEVKYTGRSSTPPAYNENYHQLLQLWLTYNIIPDWVEAKRNRICLPANSELVECNEELYRGSENAQPSWLENDTPTDYDSLCQFTFFYRDPLWLIIAIAKEVKKLPAEQQEAVLNARLPKSVLQAYFPNSQQKGNELAQFGIFNTKPIQTSNDPSEEQNLKI